MGGRREAVSGREEVVGARVKTAESFFCSLLDADSRSVLAAD